MDRKRHFDHERANQLRWLLLIRISQEQTQRELTADEWQVFTYSRDPLTLLDPNDDRPAALIVDELRDTIRGEGVPFVDAYELVDGGE